MQQPSHRERRTRGTARGLLALHPPLSSSFTKTWVAINRGHLSGLVASRSSAHWTATCVRHNAQYTITANQSAAVCSHTEPMQRVSVSHQEGEDDLRSDRLSPPLSLHAGASKNSKMHFQLIRRLVIQLFLRGVGGQWGNLTCFCVFSALLALTLHRILRYADGKLCVEVSEGGALPFTRCPSFFLSFLFCSVVTGVSERARGKNFPHFLFHPERCVCREGLKSNQAFILLVCSSFLIPSQCDMCVLRPARSPSY